jgi:adenine-specific DNA-methyltransferase
VLTRAVLGLIREDLATAAPGFAGDLVVYGAACRLSEATLKEQSILFRQTPYDISARA